MINVAYKFNFHTLPVLCLFCNLIVNCIYCRFDRYILNISDSWHLCTYIFISSRFDLFMINCSFSKMFYYFNL